MSEDRERRIAGRIRDAVNWEIFKLAGAYRYSPELGDRLADATARKLAHDVTRIAVSEANGAALAAVNHPTIRETPHGTD